VDSFATFKSTFNAVDLGGRGGGTRAGVEVFRLCSGGGPLNGGGGPVNGGDGPVNGGDGPVNSGGGPVNGGGGPVNGGEGPAKGDGGAGNIGGGLEAGDTCRFNIPRLVSAGLPPRGRCAKECRRRGREGGRREQLQPPMGGTGRPMAVRSSGDGGRGRPMAVDSTGEGGTGRPMAVRSSGDGGRGRPMAVRSSTDGMGRPAALGGRGGTTGSA
jgi:hypothetical protein